MNDSIAVLKEAYRPYRITIKGKTTILETSSGNYIVKEKGENDLQELFSYLKSREFYQFPSLIENNRGNYNVFLQYEDTNMPLEQRANDMINVVSSLHHKTTFYKEITNDSINKLYDSINNNIEYYIGLYETRWHNIFLKTYFSPSEYLFVRNYSKIISSLQYAKNNLDDWYVLVKNETSKRVVLNHNNLNLEHFLKNEHDVLLSWDNARVDSPVLDLIKFYQNDYLKIDFVNIFNKYLEKYPLTESEQKLFNAVIAIPKELPYGTDQFSNILTIREILDYIYKTEYLLIKINKSQEN